MAEFQKFMRQFDRMCKANAGCINCPLHERDNGPDRCSIDAFIKESKRVECEVMAWAEEHPEPVYPTWYEYLNKMYGAAFGDLRVIGRQPISADIAQKLGIEPKEDNDAK